jgi:hypothetical protein
MHCEECGSSLIWGGMAWVEHTEEQHRVRRKVLMRVIRSLLLQEVSFRQHALDAHLWGGVLVVWRIVMPTEVKWFRTGIPYEVWDAETLEQDWLLADMGRDLRDSIQDFTGIRVHPMRTKFRVFDGRTIGSSRATQ